MEEVNIARAHLGLKPVAETGFSFPSELRVSTKPGIASHEDIKAYLLEIGRIQGYIAEEEYPLDSTRLDVVWRKVERSVPTFVFEIQIGGDIYHAMAKLKHAFDLWNSNIFLVATIANKSKYED